ncbi:hypothetical protein T11_439 [Trichinella zimbabwensis]|uniref:Reverse transcriptase domain-containing protein n=1 Tax=Trichinella zimbabwensis TaxID=268475 RepID=A0A0V1GSJ4_9BILA|nr:hypothetical protein T11_439 [Trichinella zimbabwensis]
MDGTFKSVPQWYQQLFTIYVFVAGNLVPGVCCLCTGMAANAKARSRKLAANKARLNRLLTELEELSIDPVDDDVLAGQLGLTEALFRETDALQADWEQNLEAEEQSGAIEDWSKSRRLFLKARARAHARLRQNQNDRPSRGDGNDTCNPRQAAAPTRIGKLPELTLPQFDGEVLEFPTFWAQFEASVHRRNDLDSATKFAYLLSSTVGRARNAIAGIPVTATHYPHAVAILEKRFGRPKNLARAHFLALWKAPECHEMTRHGIQSLVDELTKHLRCLAAMEDARMMEKFEESLSFDGERYQVGLPWSGGQADLPVNIKQAMRRLTAVERRLARSDKDSSDYSSTMRQYLENGWAEPATESGPLKRTWYLPHHAVYKGEGGERKCRVVFDGSARYGGTSLNSQLEAGSPIQTDLLRALLRFRRFRVGLQADIEKMYLQVQIREEDRDACRFLWRDETQRVRKYRLTRVCFGLTCSPFLAMGTVRVHARRHQASAPRAAAEVLHNMYVDDLATSCESPDEARTLATQLEELMASGGFHLHKWASNEPAALREIPTEKRSTETQGFLWKTLRIYWDRTKDHLSFIPLKIPCRDGRDSKRQMLRTASSIFDLIGVLAPFTVRAKILFQSLWQLGVSWDETLPDDVNCLWVKWKQELKELPLINVPRAVVPVTLAQARRVELHAFCDASERAYGAVVYLRVETASRSARVNLVVAKTRVAPVKRLSLPRLELMGALTAARLIHFVQGALQLDIHSISCWSDSEVTLAWVRSAASRWKPFVRNRVEEIQQLVEPTCWRHCPGKSNPADLLSRGASLKGLAKSNNWWQGPRWLAEPTKAWPRKRDSSDRNPPLPPEKVRHSRDALLVSVVAHTPIDFLHPERYSDIERLFRISALCLRFGRNCRSTAGDQRSGPLTVRELNAAEQVWVRIA